MIDVLLVLFVIVVVFFGLPMGLAFIGDQLPENKEEEADEQPLKRARS